MASRIGVPVTMDMLETQTLTQHKVSRSRRTVGKGRGGIMKGVAKKSVNRGKKFENLYDRLCQIHSIPTLPRGET